MDRHLHKPTIVTMEFSLISSSYVALVHCALILLFEISLRDYFFNSHSPLCEKTILNICRLTVIQGMLEILWRSTITLHFPLMTTMLIIIPWTVRRHIAVWPFAHNYISHYKCPSLSFLLLGSFIDFISITFPDERWAISAKPTGLLYTGGWWYTKCHEANLNGIWYSDGDVTEYGAGASWEMWKGYFTSYKTIFIRISNWTEFDIQITSIQLHNNIIMFSLSLLFKDILI